MEVLTEEVGSSATFAAADMDGDGNKDIVVLSSPEVSSGFTITMESTL